MGGAGPLHGCPLADDLGITRIIIPRLPGVLSAAGLLAAPIEHEASAAFPCPLAMVDMSETELTIAQLDERCTALMHERVDADALRVATPDVCSHGQAYSLEVELHASRSDAMDRLTKDFFAVQ